MISDLLDFASGRVPYGIWLLVAALISFSFVWWFAWHKTRFWGIERFWRVLAIGWALAFSLYMLEWAILKPPPIPQRIIVLAGEPGEIAPGAWADAVAAAMRARLAVAAEDLTVLDSETAPMAFGAKDMPEMERAAVPLRVKGILQILQSSAETENPTIRMIYRVRRGGEFSTVAEVTAPPGSLRQTMTWAGAQAQEIFDLKPISADWLNVPGTVSDSLLELHYLNFSIRRRGDFDLAAAFFSSEAMADSHWSAPRVELAKTRLMSKPDLYRDEILGWLLDAARLDRENPEIYLLLGQRFLRTRDWEEAESALKLAFNYAPDDPRVFYNLSRLLPTRLEGIYLQRPDQLLRRALQLAPGYEAARVALITYFRNRQPIGTATDVAEEGLDVDPESEKVLLAASAVEVERQLYDLAEEHLNRILKRNPDHPEALYNLGLAKYWKKEYEGAITAFDSSFAHGGPNDNLYYLGRIYQDMGDYPTAISWYQKRFVRMQSQDDMGAVSAREKINYLRGLLAGEKEK